MACGPTKALKEKAEKAELALYAAARKAGFSRDLERAQVEVYVNGRGELGVLWDEELREFETFIFPKEAFARAEAWIVKYNAKKGEA